MYMCVLKSQRGCACDDGTENQGLAGPGTESAGSKSRFKSNPTDRRSSQRRQEGNHFKFSAAAAWGF
jgi:hypothetical protein